MPRINFDKLTKMQQRVVIAKDLIARIQAKTFLPSSGTYLMPKRGEWFRGLDGLSRTTEVRDALKGKACRGCEIGGLFLCAVDRHNKLRLGDLGAVEENAQGFNEYLRRWFSEEDLALLEQAFEGWYEFADWRDAHPRDSERMVLIAKNMIKNKGRFVPAQLLKT